MGGRRLSASLSLPLKMIKVSPPRPLWKPGEAEAVGRPTESISAPSPRELFGSARVLVPESPSDTIGESLAPPPRILSGDLGASALLSGRAKARTDGEEGEGRGEREGDGERERREGTKNSRALPLSVSLFLPLFLSQWRMPPPLSVLLPFPPLTFDARGRRVDVQGVSGRMMFLWPSSEHFIVIMLSGLVWLRPPRFLLCSFLLRICFLSTEGVGDSVNVMYRKLL